MINTTDPSKMTREDIYEAINDIYWIFNLGRGVNDPAYPLFKALEQARAEADKYRYMGQK